MNRSRKSERKVRLTFVEKMACGPAQYQRRYVSQSSRSDYDGMRSEPLSFYIARCQCFHLQWTCLLSFLSYCVSRTYLTPNGQELDTDAYGKGLHYYWIWRNRIDRLDGCELLRQLASWHEAIGFLPFPMRKVYLLVHEISWNYNDCRCLILYLHPCSTNAMGCRSYYAGTWCYGRT